MANSDCTGVECWISNQIDILKNIASNMESVEKLVSGAAYLIGIAFAFKGIYSLKVYGEARSMSSSQTGLKEPLAYLLVGALLIFLPSTFEMMMNTTFGYSSVLAYAPISSNSDTLSWLFGPDSSVGRPLAVIIQTIGLIAFIRGWVLIAKSASQGQQAGSMGKGFMHVFGGILAMNIIGTLEIITNTIYGT